MATEVKPREEDLSLERMQARQEQERIDFVAKNNPDYAKNMQLVLDNPDKTIYLDTRDGAKITTLDGDKETIKPFLAHQHEQAVAKAGGVDALIEQRTTEMKEADMPQAVMDKESEIMRAAEGDGQKYADLRFENNAFFAEQAKAAGEDPAAANDIVASHTVTKTELTTGKMVDGKMVMDEKVPEEPSTQLAYDPKAMVPLFENGRLTNIGNVEMVTSQLISNDTKLHEVSNDFFDNGIKEHGTMKAFAEHVKTNGVSGDGIYSDSNQEQCGRLAGAILQSEGRAELFSAATFKSINENKPEQDLAQKNVQDTKNTQDTLLASAEKADDGGLQNLFSGDMDLGQMLEQFLALFKGMTSGNMSLEQVTAQISEKFGGKKEKDADKTDEAENKEVVAATENNKDPEKTAVQENQHIAYTQKDGVAGQPVVNKAPDAENYVMLKTPDGEKTLSEGFNDTANEPSERVAMNFIDHAKSEEVNEQKNDAADPEHEDDNTVQMGMC